MLIATSTLAILGIRLGVWLIPEIDIKLFRTVIHHFWIGVFFVALSYPLSAFNHTFGILSLGFGLGLIADELVFMVRGGGHDKQYWTLPSVTGSILLLALTFYFRDTLASLLY